MTTIIRCTIGCMLGSALGVVWMMAGEFQQGLGLATVGGILGIILALSNVFYEASAWKSFSRGAVLFLKWTAAKNIPGGEKLVPIEDEVVVSRRGATADSARLEGAMWLGGKLGAATVAIAAMVLIVIYSFNVERKLDWTAGDIFERVLLSLIQLFLAGIAGGGCGAAIGALAVPGVHRRNIVLGTTFGVMIGIGMATATANGRGVKITVWQSYGFCCGMLGWMGMACGLFSGDNFRRDDYEQPRNIEGDGD